MNALALVPLVASLGAALQSGTGGTPGGLPPWAPLLIAPLGALGFLLYYYLFARD